MDELPAHKGRSPAEVGNLRQLRDNGINASKTERTRRVREFSEAIINAVSRRLGRAQPHLESPQLKHVMQPSIMTAATVLHLLHS
jgi:hypothetical protein